MPARSVQESGGCRPGGRSPAADPDEIAVPRLSPSVVALALASLAAVPAAAMAQEATPAASPVAADPAECRIEPRPAAVLEDALRTAVASLPPAPTFPPGGGTVNPAPIVVSEEGSVPADAETVAAVRATAREFAACANAGDLPRLFALDTEQAARDGIVFINSARINRSLDAGTPAAVLEAEFVEGLAGFGADAATPVAAENRLPEVDVANVRRLADGRVVADLFVPGFEGRQGFLFAEEGGRYLIVGNTAMPDGGTPAATPVP